MPNNTPWGEAALSGEIEKLSGAVKGERNDTLNHCAFKIGQLVATGDIDERDARAELYQTALGLGVDGSFTLADIKRTIESGLNGGRSKPRADPPDPVPAGAPFDPGDGRGLIYPPGRNGPPGDSARSTPGEGEAPPARVQITPASAIRTRRVRWLWDARLAIGIVALLAGREALGKSSFAYWLAARVTRGELPGEYHGQPRGVLVCATEDSWAHTIVPRLIAVGADLDQVFRVEVVSADDIHVGLSLPRDLAEVERVAGQVGAALLLLDPLLSRISAGLDVNKDPEVRRALEPMAALADRAGLTVLGIIHLNKTGSTDILDRVMSSKAIVAVARAVCAVVRDPDDEQGRRRLFGVPKNNLGRDDLPSIQFTIEGAKVRTDDGAVTEVGRVVIGDETGTTIGEAMERNGEDPDMRTQTADAKAWLTEYLTEHSHADSRDVKEAAAKEKISERTLHRARKTLRVVVTSLPGVPFRTVWSMPAKPGPAPVSGLSNRASRARGDAIDGIDGIDTGQSDSGDQGGTVNRAIYDNGAMLPRAHARTREAETCQCETPKARQLGDGRWFCRECGREINTEAGS